VVSPHLFGVCFKKGFLSIYNTKKLEEIFQVKAHMGEAMDLAFSPLNDKLVCTVGSDETMKLFDVIEKKSVKGVQVSFKASSCCFAPDG
jgi:WD40 repeat protein